MLAESEDLEHPGHVARCLTGPHDVPVDLAGSGSRLETELGEILDRLVATPPLMVDTGVDDHAGRSEQLHVEAAEVAEAVVVVDAGFVSEPLCVERPALAIGGKGDEPPKEGKLLLLHLQGDLEVVPGHRLVVGQGRHGGLVGKAVQVDEERALTGAVHGRRYVVGVQPALLVRGDALDGHGCLRDHAERGFPDLSPPNNGLA